MRLKQKVKVSLPISHAKQMIYNHFHHMISLGCIEIYQEMLKYVTYFMNYYLVFMSRWHSLQGQATQHRRGRFFLQGGLYVVYA